MRPHSVPKVPLQTLGFTLGFRLQHANLRGGGQIVYSNLTKNRQMQVFLSRRCLDDESTQRRHNVRNESHQK